MSVCICTLALTVLTLYYLDNVKLIDEKMQIAQLARKYILRMEVAGSLTDRDRLELDARLLELGVTDRDYTGTTIGTVDYGEPIVLCVRGKLRGKYEFEEKRSSTSKN